MEKKEGARKWLSGFVCTSSVSSRSVFWRTVLVIAIENKACYSIRFYSQMCPISYLINMINYVVYLILLYVFFVCFFNAIPFVVLLCSYLFRFLSTRPFSSNFVSMYTHFPCHSSSSFLLHFTFRFDPS